MKKTRKRSIKEQIKDVKVQGLPNPAEFASRITSSGASPEEILGWLGAVLSRAGMTAPSTGTEEVAIEDTVTVPPPPMPTAAAIEEKFERKLLDSLLRDVNRSVRKK